MAHRSLAARRRGLALAGGGALVLLLAAIAATVVADRRAADARGRPFVVAAPERIGIVRPGFADIALVRAPRGADADIGTAGTTTAPKTAWRIEAPCSLAASGARVAPLLEALEASRATLVAGDVDLAGAGLVPPVATLVVDGRRIDVGGPDLAGSRRYLRAGDDVGFAPEWLGSLLGGGMTAFADPAVIGVTVRSVDGSTAPAAAAAWSALEAIQTVEWPPAHMPPVLGERRVALAPESGPSFDVDVATTAAWHAVLVDGGRCARIVGVDELPG